MTTRARRRRGVRLVDRPVDEVVHPFRPPEPEPAVDADATPEPDPLEEAYARGVHDGAGEARAVADARMEQELTAIRGELAAALIELARLEDRIRHETTSLMTELALESAARIVRERIDAGDAIAARALAEAVDALPEIDGLAARVHPDDVISIRDELGELIERRRIELQPDETIARGGCVVESRAGSIDARIETAIESVRRAASGESG